MATDRAGFAQGATLSYGDLGQLFTTSPALGTDYTGVWSDDSTLTITVLNSAGHGISTSNRNLALTCRPPPLTSSCRPTWGSTTSAAACGRRRRWRRSTWRRA